VRAWRRPGGLPAWWRRTGVDAPVGFVAVARRFLWASLGVAPLTVAAQYAFDLAKTPLFVLSAIALIPLAWLIGEATEHAAEHTGPGVGGFLNASFGNAPELIIATFAIADGLPDVVRGSITGSVVSNILLVLGVAIVVGGEGELDRRSLWLQLGIVFAACLAFLVPSVPSWDGSPDRHSLAVLSIPVAVALLALYVAVTVKNLRTHSQAHSAEPTPGSWSLPVSLATLGAATLLTAAVSESLVHSLDDFAESAGLSQFFIAAVIVAIVGNAAEHGGAIVIAHRGKMTLASEIAISSSAQVAVFVAPAVALLSWLVTPSISLGFRPIELATMAGAAAFVAIVIRDGRSKRWEGVLLLCVYVGIAGAYYAAGER
jgi:Ca2+:H+ antiporter